VKARIHRGAAEIGGSSVEIECAGRRLVLDVGLPLQPDAVPMRDLFPDVPGLWHEGDGTLEAVIISHGHPDHYGLADLIDPSVPILVGEATARILKEASFFAPRTRTFPVAGHLCDGETRALGPFLVTPILVDHSAYDSYALIVEAGGRRLIYSGDVRVHGRKSSTLPRLVATAADADVLLLEGTRAARDDRQAMSEADVEQRLVDLARATEGILLVAASGQNVDRLMSLFRAARRNGRQLVADLYAEAVVVATGRPSIPTAATSNLRVFVPSAQRRQVIAARAFERTHAVRAARVFPEELAAHPERFVMLFRSSMIGDLDRADCLAGARLAWSMWRGYLAIDQAVLAFVKRLRSPLAFVHASGHADAQDVRRLIRDLRPCRVVPIHTDAPDAFNRLSERVRTPRRRRVVVCVKRGWRVDDLGEIDQVASEEVSPREAPTDDD
jgi:ribonuclease J